MAVYITHVSVLGLSALPVSPQEMSILMEGEEGEGEGRGRGCEGRDTHVPSQT